MQWRQVQSNKHKHRATNTGWDNGRNHKAMDVSMGGAGASAGQQTCEQGWVNEGKGKGWWMWGGTNTVWGECAGGGGVQMSMRGKNKYGEVQTQQRQQQGPCAPCLSSPSPFHQFFLYYLKFFTYFMYMYNCIYNILMKSNHRYHGYCGFHLIPCNLWVG